MAIWLDCFGVTATTPEMEAVLGEVKVRSLETKSLLGEDEFAVIVDQVLPGRRREPVPTATAAE